MTGEDEDIEDVIENALLVYSKQLNFFMIIYLSINKELQQNKYQNQDSHHHHYQYDFFYKKLLLNELN